MSLYLEAQIGLSLAIARRSLSFFDGPRNADQTGISARP
jgi:hypothetical protein